MEKEQVRQNEMATGKIPTVLLKMALPMMFSMVVSALYNIIDSIFIGMIEAPFNEKAITALGYAFPLQMLLVAVAIGTGIGVNAILSKALGQGKKDEAAKSCAMGYALMIVFYLVFLIFGVLLYFTDFYFSSVTNDEVVIQMGSSYLGVCFIFSFGQLLQLVSERALCATGKTQLAMIMQLAGAITNIALDPLFILVFNMGVNGAAIATIAGQMVSMIVGFLLNLYANKEFTIRKEHFQIDFTMIKGILRVGIPAIFLQALQSLQSLVFQLVFMSLFSSNQGMQDMLVGVYGVYYKLQNFVFMAFYGLNNSMLTMVAFNYGDKDEKRCEKTAMYGYLYCLILALIGIAIFEAIPEQLLVLFNLGEEWISTGVTLARISAPTFILSAICIISIGLLQGLGSGFHPLLISLLRLLLILFPACYLFGFYFGVDAIWWGSYIAEGVAAIYGVLVLLRVFKNAFKKQKLVSTIDE